MLRNPGGFVHATSSCGWSKIDGQRVDLGGTRGIRFRSYVGRKKIWVQLKCYIVDGICESCYITPRRGTSSMKFAKSGTLDI